MIRQKMNTSYIHNNVYKTIEHQSQKNKQRSTINKVKKIQIGLQA